MAVRGSRLTLALLIGVVVVLTLGAAAALTVSDAHRRVATRPATATTSSTTAATAVRAAPPQIRSSVDVAPTAGPSNNLTVGLSAAARSDPRAQQVQQLLQAYFDAINNHDYAAWAQVVTAAQTRTENSRRWLQAYASTVDSSIWVQALSGTPLRVDLRFTSEQDPDLAPPDLQVACIDWMLTYALQEQHGVLVVGSTVPGTVSRTKCP